MTQGSSIEERVRHRLRTLRVSRDWSLDELARRSFIGASTISRIETGHRRIALDQLVSLATALETSVDELLGPVDEEVVIRPQQNVVNGTTVWNLSRENDHAGKAVMKMRIPASRKHHELQVHPGRDWFYVLTGTISLTLGERTILVEEGHAAEFNTTTPHRIVAVGQPADVITIFDRDGERAHLH